jgi:hypothetical protein
MKDPIKVLLLTSKDGYEVCTIQRHDINDIHRLLECRTFTTARVGKWTVYADDEALLYAKVPAPTVFYYGKNTSNIIGAIHGSIMFVKHDDRGNSISITHADLVDILYEHPLHQVPHPETKTIGYVILDEVT